MPSRFLPRTHITRIKVLNKCNAKGAVTATKPFPAALWNDLNYGNATGRASTYRAALNLVTERSQASTEGTALVVSTFGFAAKLCSHFFQVLDLAIDRGDFDASVREYHGRDINVPGVPALTSYDDVIFWAGKIATGEAQRAIDEGATFTAFTNPTPAQVAAAHTAFAAARAAQAGPKESLTLAQQAVEAIIPGATGIDPLILDLYDETEHTYRHLGEGAMRDLCREWGIIYEGDAEEEPLPTPTPTP